MKIILVGGGDNAGAVIDLIQSNQEDIGIIGISDISQKGKMVNGYTINLTDEETLQYLNDSKIIIAYALKMSTRKRLYEFFNDNHADFMKLISKYSYVSKTSNIGSGSIIMPGAIIRNQTNIGYNTIINSNATVEHGCTIGNHCHIAPGVVITGNVCIEDECFIGANSTILPNLRISKGSTIGAGSVVVKDIPEKEIWYGNPAKKYKDCEGDF